MRSSGVLGVVLLGTLVAASACGAAPHATPVVTATLTPSASAASPSPTPCSTQQMLSAWPLERLAAQTVVAPVDENDVSAVRSEVAAGAGGVILFGSHAPADLGAQVKQLDGAALGGVTPFVMADEEGGAVQRMANLVGSLPSARQMGATMTPFAIQQLAQGLATRMRAAGVTMDLAPVLDLDGGAGPNNQDADGTRSFSTIESVASADGRAFAAGLQAGGVVPVVKHFPGLGDATGNTDVSSAATLPWATLQRAGLLPFTDAINGGAPAVMIANATVPGLTDIPASISPSAITGALRGQLGFKGLVITDSLSATALTSLGYSVPRATVAAIEAGADMILFVADANKVASTTSQTVAAIVAAVDSGALPRATLQEAVAQVLATKGVTLCQ